MIFARVGDLARVCARVRVNPTRAGQVIRLGAAGQLRHRSTSDDGSRRCRTLRSPADPDARTLRRNAAFRSVASTRNTMGHSVAWLLLVAAASTLAAEVRNLAF